MSTNESPDLDRAREHFEQGLGFFRGGFYLAAWQEFQAARQLAPKLPEIDFYLEATSRKVGEVTGQLHAFMDQQFDRELHRLSERLQIQGSRPLADEIGALIRAERLDEALARLAEVEVHLPDNLPLAMMRAGLLRRANRSAEAEAVLRRAVTLHPGSAEALNNLGNLLLSRGQMTAAADCIQRALALEPNQPRILNNLAVLKMQTHRLDEALELFGRILAVAPRFKVAEQNRDRLLLRRRELDEEISRLTAETQAHPTWPDLRVQLGKALLFRGCFARSREQLREALALNPNLLSAWFYLGMLHEAEGDLVEALYHFQEMVARKGKGESPDFHAFQSFRREGYLDEALAELKKVAVLELDLAAGHINIGNAHFAQARWSEAEAEFRAAVELNPKYPDAWHRLALSLIQQGRSTEARRALARALDLNPQFANAHYHLGIQLRVDRPAQARRHLEQAIELGVCDQFHQMARSILAKLPEVETPPAKRRATVAAPRRASAGAPARNRAGRAAGRSADDRSAAGSVRRAPAGRARPDPRPPAGSSKGEKPPSAGRRPTRGAGSTKGHGRRGWRVDAHRTGRFRSGRAVAGSTVGAGGARARRRSDRPACGGARTP